MTLCANDYLFEHEIWPKLDPAKPIRVWRIVQSDKHSHFLFVAPTLMFRPKQTARQIEVHVFPAANMQEIRLIEDVRIIVQSRAAIRDIKTQTDSSMRSAIVAPKQDCPNFG